MRYYETYIYIFILLIFLIHQGKRCRAMPFLLTVRSSTGKIWSTFETIPGFAVPWFILKFDLWLLCIHFFGGGFLTCRLFQDREVFVCSQFHLLIKQLLLYLKSVVVLEINGKLFLLAFIPWALPEESLQRYSCRMEIRKWLTKKLRTRWLQLFGWTANKTWIFFFFKLWHNNKSARWGPAGVVCRRLYVHSTTCDGRSNGFMCFPAGNQLTSLPFSIRLDEKNKDVCTCKCARVSFLVFFFSFFPRGLVLRSRINKRTMTHQSRWIEMHFKAKPRCLAAVENFSCAFTIH